MAVTSLWRIKGYIGKVILYAENPDKTISIETILTQSDETDPSEVLKDVLEYAERESATEGKRLVSGVNCDPSNAANEMMQVKRFFGKTGGVTAYHGYQSFAQNEVDADTAHLIGVELANRLWGDKYQVVVTTHTDTESHFHNHFILNTVSFVDGIKYHRTKDDYRQMRKVSDEICREHGLSIIENPNNGSHRFYIEYTADKNGEFTKNGVIRRDIDECVMTATNMRQFFDDMKKRGYTFDLTHKYATVYHANFKKARRLKTLGEAYTLEAIQQRVSGNWVRREYVYPEQDKPEKLFFNGDIKTALVFYNYQTVYVHFVRGLAVVKERGEYNRELQRLLGDELIKFDKRVEEQNLLLDNDLYTHEDITDFKEQCHTEMNELIEVRKQLRNQLKRAVRADNVIWQNDIQAQIRNVSQRIHKLRRNIIVCDRILSIEPKIESDLRAVKDYTESLNRKERTPNEHIRRRSRTSRENYA